MKAINYTDAILRLGGNTSLYKKIVKKFLDEYSDIPKNLEGKISQKQYSEALILAHTFKGISGSVGASTLQKICDDLEKALNSRMESSFNILIDQFKKEFKDVLNELKFFLEKEPR